MAEDPAKKRERMKRWRAANSERIKEQARRWREAHPERVLEYRQQYYQENRKRILEKQSVWAKANRPALAEQARRRYHSDLVAARERAGRYREQQREARRANQSARRAKLHGADADLTLQDWLDLLEEFDYCCAYCQARHLPLVQEHMTPLSRGGRHTKSNVVPACGTCNNRKYTRTLFEFAGVGPFEITQRDERCPDCGRSSVVHTEEGECP